MTLRNCSFEATPYDQSRIIKNANLININYTNQDFWSMKTRLIDFIKERFGNDFNDFVESSIAIMLIENWAFIADTLSFKIDQIANEIYIDTVSEVDNAFRLSLLVGYKPRPPIASRSLWSGTLNNILETDLIINTPVEIAISTEDGPKTVELFPADSFNEPLLDDPIIISAGNTVNTSIIGLEGRTRLQNSTGTGEMNQSIALTDGPVIWDSVRVQVDGVDWVQVDYFTDSQPRQEYRVEYDPNYNGFVMFGNNRAGMIPSPSSAILITYRTGGGVAGNIVTGSIELQRNYGVPGFGIRVPVVFRNYTKGEYGYDGDTIDDIKKKLPQFLRTQNRAVTGDDYETISNQFATAFNGSVGKATAVLRNYGCAANIIDIYVLARSDAQNLAEATNELKVALKEELDSKKMLTDYVCIKDGSVIEVDINLDVIMDKFYKKFEDEYRIKLTRKIESFFSLNNWNYGQSLKAVDLVKEVSDIKEIRSIDINFVTDTDSGELITAKFYEIIRSSTIDINFVYE